MKKLVTFVTFIFLFTACQESLEDKCEREAKEYTRKNCPMKMDNHSILDSMTFERTTRTIHYYYTLTGFADQDGVMEKVDAVGVLRKELKNSTALRTYKDNKFRVAYTYRSQKDPKKILLDVVFTDKDY
jgi:hypothetical protein